ncbi:VanZ family protein [Pseudobutyrivibrio sp. MD2005]|uniref:VanZ family protein n=1 Tax=Pseudobutyrivibrio sp. MD2005 TaxID=1410616 RepID=UPI0009DFD166|nr:VanZ family protein [Pseudobutyrivibrio sp. MD2005]
MKKRKIIIRILIALWLCLIWGHSLQPAVVSEAESGKFLAILGKIFPFLLNTDFGMFIVRKAAHFAEYFILGVLLCMNFQMDLYGIVNRLSVPVLVGTFVAFIDETIQLFVIGRSGEIRDMWIDFVGVALGTLIVLAVVNNKRGRKRY